VIKLEPELEPQVTYRYNQSTWAERDRIIGVENEAERSENRVNGDGAVSGRDAES